MLPFLTLLISLPIQSYTNLPKHYNFKGLYIPQMKTNSPKRKSEDLLQNRTLMLKVGIFGFLQFQALAWCVRFLNGDTHPKDHFHNHKRYCLVFFFLLKSHVNQMFVLFWYRYGIFNECIGYKKLQKNYFYLDRVDSNFWSIQIKSFCRLSEILSLPARCSQR